MDQTFSPVSRLDGRLTMPADKSIAHRALMFAGMAAGTSRITGQISGEDVNSTRRCMEALGVEFTDEAPGTLIVKGTGWEVPEPAALDCGNSGTTMRLLSGALAGRKGTFTLSGDDSLSRRPMDRVAEPLRLMGANVRTSEGGRPPLTIRGGSLKPVVYRTPVPSAQVKSAILLAGLQADGLTTVQEDSPSRDHTERILAWLGCRILRTEGQVSVQGGDQLFGHGGFEMELPGDLSSAAFWLVAALLSPAGMVVIEGVGLNPGRTGIIEILALMGADLGLNANLPGPEPAGTLFGRACKLRSTEVSGDRIPAAVDELPLVALAATQAEGTTVIRDAAELRVKETDRIAVLAEGLRTLGAKVEERPDGLIIEGPTPLTGGVVQAAGDHRMALTFAVAGLIAREPVTVQGWDAASVSYPGFLDDLKKVAG
ncbi:MAG TPA: 3-phosphoshikimate 1-carboxyvinyltransferase [Actinomycetota bacterium]|nr:3-phosphoshikimate 1-carboxyvinyltransferase [Actinomycetota bacterium]